MLRPRRPWRRARAGAVAVVALAAVTAAPQPAAGVGAVTVAAGYGPSFVPGRHLPVSVTVEADRLLRGELEVTLRVEAFGAATSRARLAVEVPGGSRKTFVAVVPPLHLPQMPGQAAATVRARLLDGGGRTLAESDRQGLQVDAGLELVGILPGRLAAGDLPRTAPLAVEAGVARLVKLTRAQLTQAPASLDPLGTIAAAPPDLAALAPPVRQAVLHWLGDGGQLLVDAAAGTPVDGLPPSWQPGPEGWSSAGMGRVRLTGGALAAGGWDRLVEPTPVAAGPDLSHGFIGPASVGDALAVDAGVRTPGLGWLLAFLVVYVVVVGPVTAVVLGRRRRSELAWVVVPVLAVAFTGLSWAGANRARQDTRLAHGTAIEFDAPGARETTYVGMAARGRRTSLVSLPEGWAASANPSTAASALQGTAAAPSVRLTGRGPAARLDLGPGQFGVVRGVRGRAGPVEGPAVAAASTENGLVEGTVRNLMPHALEEAAVFVGSSGVALGRLEPGEERRWTVARHDRGWELPVEVEIWPAAAGRMGRVDTRSVVNFALWQATAGQAGRPRPAGVAVAVGWTRDHRPTVLVDDEPRRPVGRTVVVSRAPVEAPGRITDMSVRGETVRSAAFDAGFPTAVARFTLPPGRPPPAALVASLPAGGQAPEVWVDGRWRALDDLDGPDPSSEGAGGAGAGARPLPAEPAGPAPRPAPAPVPPPPFAFRGDEAGAFGPSRLYSVPAAAVGQGVVFVRLPFAGVPTEALRLWGAS